MGESKMSFSTCRWMIGLSAASVMALFNANASAQTLPNLKGKTFVFASFGGDLQKNEDAAWLQPFAAATGVKVDQTESPDLAALQTQQEAHNVSADVIEIEGGTVDAGCGTVFAKVDIDRSQLNSVYDKNKCGVPVVKFSYVLAYNSAKYPNPPKSVADFFNFAKFPGSRAVNSQSNSGIIETALLADGVERTKIYPIDLDRAIAKINSAKDSIKTVETFALIQDGLANGEYDMALLPNGRAMNASKINSKIKAVFVDAVTLYDNLAIPTGAKNLQPATAFLQYVAMNKTQVALAERFPYGMGTTGEAPKLADQAKSFFPDSYTDQLLVQDSAWWGANDATVKDRLTSVFSQ
jgi:putative spermidine/putrescine transport system substrate-binding protein